MDLENGSTTSSFPKATRTAAASLIEELRSMKLEVTLIPAPSPKHPDHKIRAVVNQNPGWYQALCAEYPSRRSRPRQRRGAYVDTRIKRAATLKALGDIAQGSNGTAYTKRLLPICQAYAKWIAEEEPKTEVFIYDIHA